MKNLDLMASLSLANVENEGGEGSGSVQTTSLSLNLASHQWNPIFETHRTDACYEKDNDRLTNTVDFEKEDFIRSFMRNYDELDASLYRADMVAQYCFGASWEGLQDDEGGGKRKVALLDERSSLEGEEQVWEYQGPLTARDLCRRLLRLRFSVDSYSSMSSKDKTVATTSIDHFSVGNLDSKLTPEPEPEPDAERRKIFITNLDCWSIYALLATASKSQAPSLCDAIYKHLAFQSFLKVKFFHRGLVMFQLVFHMPFYAWRKSNKVRGIDRSDRRRENVSYLTNPSSGSFDFLYGAQFSCLINGTDKWNWVAYCFVDNYFDDEAKDAVEAYHQVNLEEGVASTYDPFTFGTIEVNHTPPTPREYFLFVLRIRISRVKLEWENVIARIQPSIEEYSEAFSVSLYISRDRSTTDKVQRQRVRWFYDWSMRTRRLTEELLYSLSNTVDVGEEFFLNSTGYFEGLTGSSQRPNGILNTIKVTFEELQSLQNKLQSLVERCKSYSLSLKTILELERDEVEVISRSSWLDHLPFLNSMVGNVPRHSPSTSALYSQLNIRNSEIRLLKFMPPWSGSTLVCSLVTVPLPKAPKYVALSYHWGEQTQKVPMLLNNFDFEVTANLNDALLQLQAKGFLYVWADALCINQQDQDEKGFQVGRMGAIFQKACQVVVWLGEEPRVVQEMRLLEHDTSYLNLDHYSKTTISAMFDELLSRPFWGRVWIIQEVTLAVEVVIYFGRCMISWDEFVSKCGVRLETSTVSPCISSDNARRIGNLLQFRQDKLFDRPIHFLEALYRSRSSISTDPRDKLFAILGLSFNGKNFIPEPDYISLPKLVFTEFMVALLKSPAPLDYIYLRSARRKNSDELPSWVIVWTDLDDLVARRQFDYIIQGPSRRSEFNIFERKNSITISETELTVNGRIVDTVSGLGNIFVGGQEDFEAPTFAKSQTQVLLDLGSSSEARILVFETFTGIGLLPERAYDNKDRFYSNLDGPWSDDQIVEHELLQSPEHEFALELLPFIETWLAENSSFNISGQSLKSWWDLLRLTGGQIGDAPRITQHLYNSIQCGMRLLATERCRIGWIHPQAQIGDKIVQISGCRQHVVLRAVQKRYRVVGDAILSRKEIGDCNYEDCKKVLRLI